MAIEQSPICCSEISSFIFLPGTKSGQNTFNFEREIESIINNHIKDNEICHIYN